MGNEIVADLENLLRSGKVDQALQVARRHCVQAGGSKESALEVAKAAANVYRELIAPPVHEFVTKVSEEIGGEPGTLIEKAVGRLISINDKWDRRLMEVHTERLARDMRDALRERRVDLAARNAAMLLTDIPAEARARRAGYIGGVLGTALHNQKEAREMLLFMTRDLHAHNLTAELVRIIETAREKRHGEMTGANLEAIEREFRTNLTEAIVELMNVLPDKSKMGEPDEAMLRETGDAVRSLLRVPIVRENADLLTDATQILVDFVPKEESATATLAKVEGRAWSRLGFTAKKTIVLVFQDIGRNHFFTGLYSNWARGLRDTGADLKPIIELMGAMRSQDFAPFFEQIRKDPRLSSTYAPQVTGALGATGGEQNAEALLSRLFEIVRSNKVDLTMQREAERIVSALAGILKSPRSAPAERQRIVDQLKNNLPDNMSRLQVLAAETCFTIKPEEMSSAQRQWALKIMARGLWLPDTASAHETVGDRVSSELGPRRAALVDSMVRIAMIEPTGTIRAIETQATRYGIGIIAAAEVLDKARIFEAVPLLERMLLLAVQHDESSANNYQQEMLVDPANQTKVPLKKEKVLIALVHAIGSLGGAEAEAVLRRYVEQIRVGRFPEPSPELAQTLSRYVAGEALTARTTASVIAQRATADESESGSGINADPIEVEAMLKQLGASYFFSGKEKRRAKKVEALTRLARLAPVEAIDPVFKQLGDKDPLVVSAAISCLTEFAMPYQKKSVRDYVLDMCLERFASSNQAVRDGAMKLLKEIGPNRKDVRDKVVNHAKAIDDRRTKEAIVNVLRATSGSGSGDTTMRSFSSILKSESDIAGGRSGSASDNIAKLEARRAYHDARKAWIDGGKKGPPPEKPAGVD